MATDETVTRLLEHIEESVQFDDYYESPSNGLRAFTDGIHPSRGFAEYILMVAVQLAETTLGSQFTDSANTRVPILIVVAAGWNHEQQTQDKVEVYKEFLPRLLYVKTVGQPKKNYPAFRMHYQTYMPKRKKYAAWEKLESTFGF